MLPHKRSLEFARTSLLNYRNQDVIISPDWAGKPLIPDQPILDQAIGSADLAPIQREWILPWICWKAFICCSDIGKVPGVESQQDPSSEVV